MSNWRKKTGKGKSKCGEIISRNPREKQKQLVLEKLIKINMQKKS